MTFVIFLAVLTSIFHPRAVIGQHGKPGMIRFRLLVDRSTNRRHHQSLGDTMPGGLANFFGSRIFRFLEVYMNNLNSVLIEGNMVKDPMIRSTPKGTQVCNFCIASNRYYRQDSNLEQETGFFDIEAWGKLAEACISKGHKGRGVRVVGRLKQGRWTGDDGKYHSRVSIVAEHVEYRKKKKKTGVSASEIESVAEAAWDEKPEMERDQYEFHKKNVPVEEFSV
jgi:single-strand DNA-binding protein